MSDRLDIRGAVLLALIALAIALATLRGLRRSYPTGLRA
jgi:hypothetical protein